MNVPSTIQRYWSRPLRLLRRHTVPIIATWGLISGTLPLLPISADAQRRITDFYESLPIPIPESNTCLILSAICLAYWATHDLKPAIADIWEVISITMFNFRLKPSVVERYTKQARAEARAERDAEIRAKLQERGYDLDELLNGDRDPDNPDTPHKPAV